MKRTALFINTFLVSTIIHAQTIHPENDSAAKAVMLQDVIVTSNRMELKKRETPEKIDIITAKDIVMHAGLDVGDVIKKMAALDVIQRPGVATYASIRGFRPPAEPGRINPEVTVLINGRPSGTQNLALFDPNSIERIEILKDAAGAIYGSSAMGGIINIITKQSKGKVTGHLFGGYGSFNTTEAGYSVGGNIIPKLDFNFSGTFFDRNEAIRLGNGNLFRKWLGSEQVSLFTPAGTVKEYDTAFDGQKRNGTRMNYRSNSVRVGYQINDNWRLDASGASFSGRGIESSGDLRTWDAQQGTANRFFNTVDIALKGSVKNHKLLLLAYFMKEKNSTFNNYNGTTVITPSPTWQRSEGIVQWNGIQVQDVITYSNHFKFIAGADYNEATSKSRAWSQANAANNFAVTETSPSSPWSYVKTVAPFVQAYITTWHGKFIINPGARYDLINFGINPTPLFKNLTPKKENNHFVSPALGLQYNINGKWAIHSNIGRAFRFAQAFEIAGYYEEYLPGNKVRITTGNPHLKNEQSVTGDFGIKYNNVQKGAGFDITCFVTNVNNRVRQVAVAEMVGQIHTDGKTIDRYLTYTNADQSKIRGLEIEGFYDFGALKNYTYGLRVFVNATHLVKAKDITKGDAVTPDAVVRIRNVAPLNIGYGIEYDNHKAWVVRLGGRYMSKRYAQDFGNADASLRGAFMELPRYMILDLTTNYTIANQHVLSLRISNITDENYYETRGYNLPGRSVGVRYTYRF